MGTKLDQEWALGILKDCNAEVLERVRALILEIERLEQEVERLERDSGMYPPVHSCEAEK